MHDLHERKKSCLEDMGVVREHGMKVRASRYYFSGGGSVIKRVPKSGMNLSIAEITEEMQRKKGTGA